MATPETAPEPTPESAFHDLLQHCHPTRLLALGALAQAVAERWQSEHPDTELALASATAPTDEPLLSTPHDLALISDVLQTLDKAEAVLLLGHLRNLGTQQIAVLAPDRASLQFNDFIGLGFVRQARFQQPVPQTLFTYNIASYNRKRDWNNPRNWANPEMWNKARW